MDSFLKAWHETSFADKAIIVFGFYFVAEAVIGLIGILIRFLWSLKR